jgi:hypothetical protein
MEQAGGIFRVAGASERVGNVFQITHTDRILAIDRDLASSVKVLKGTEG